MTNKKNSGSNPSPGNEIWLKRTNQKRFVVAAFHDDEGGDREGEGADGQGLLPAEPVDEKDGDDGSRKLGERRPDERNVISFQEAPSIPGKDTKWKNCNGKFRKLSLLNLRLFLNWIEEKEQFF